MKEKTRNPELTNDGLMIFHDVSMVRVERLAVDRIWIAIYPARHDDAQRYVLELVVDNNDGLIQINRTEWIGPR